MANSKWSQLLNQTVIVWSVLYSLAVTDDDSSRSKAQRKVSRKKKRGSQDWEKEREETLPSPSSLLPLLFSLRFIILRYNSKYQSKGPIYVLHSFAFAAIRLFELVYFREKKGIRDSDEKSAGCQADFRGNAGSAPTPPSPPDHEWSKRSLIERSPIQHWGHRTPEQKKCLTMLNVKFERSNQI